MRKLLFITLMFVFCTANADELGLAILGCYKEGGNIAVRGGGTILHLGPNSGVAGHSNETIHYIPCLRFTGHPLYDIKKKKSVNKIDDLPNSD